MQQWRGLIERVNLWLVIDADNVDKRQLPRISEDRWIPLSPPPSKKKILKYPGASWNVLELSGTFWNILKHLETATGRK